MCLLKGTFVEYRMCDITCGNVVKMFRTIHHLTCVSPFIHNMYHNIALTGILNLSSCYGDFKKCELGCI